MNPSLFIAFPGEIDHFQAEKGTFSIHTLYPPMEIMGRFCVGSVKD